MKALLLLAALGLGGYAAYAHARDVDSMPVLGAEPAGPASRADAFDPALQPAAATLAADGSAARAPAQAQPAPARALVVAARPRHAPAAKRPARAAGGDSEVADPTPAAGGVLRPAAQPLRARPVLSWQSLLPGSIQ